MSSSVCSNCGKPGHFFRECREPITSLGILAYRQPKGSSEPEWLMICRRDSLGFIELMRGKYELSNTTAIQTLIDQMTVKERDRLLGQSFHELWLALWNGPASRRYHAEYEQAKLKFETLKKSGRLASSIAISKTTWTEPEWGFPKGRRSSTESELTCAFRETQEEAGVGRGYLHLVPGIEPFIEEFIGSNGIRYRHKYWLATAPSDLVVGLDPTNADQRREIGDVRWFTYDNALAKIRPYNTEKRTLLGKARDALQQETATPSNGSAGSHVS